SQLPSEVVQRGVSVRKSSSTMLMVIVLYSPNGTYDDVFLGNYAGIYLKDALSRVKGVGDVNVFTARDYGMRIWLDPDRMTSLGLGVNDVIQAIRDQNIQAAAGQIGAPPSSPDQQFQYSILSKGRLTEPSEFRDIIVRARPNGSLVRIGDVAKVDLGAQNYSSFGRMDGQPCVVFGVFQLPEANALDVADAVSARLEGLSQQFPDDVAYKVVRDETQFIRESLWELVQTLFIALGLVVLVVFIFLQDWRSTLIPVAAIPVSLVGTFSFLHMFGFSINSLTLFGLVLAIGLVVDDAIIVIENVQRHIEGGLPPKQAAEVAMSEVTGPIVASALVLAAVFVPVAFAPGITGELYRQFAVTIVISFTISAFVALSLSPALCAHLLRSNPPRPFFLLRWFNSGFKAVTGGYRFGVRFLSRRLEVALLVFAVVVGAVYVMYRDAPKGFLPTEDQGVVFSNVLLPDGASLARTKKVTRQVEQAIETIPGIDHINTIGGSGGANAARVIIGLKDWNERTTPDLSVQSILAQIRSKVGRIQGAQMFAYQTPPIRGLGATAGFELQLEDLTGGDPQGLAQAMRALVAACNQDPRIQNMFSTYQSNVPRLQLQVDRRQAEALGVPVGDIFRTLQTNLGSLYVNDFNLFGRVFRVIIQADTSYRNRQEDIGRMYVKSSRGAMVPLKTLVSLEPRVGPDTLNRFNMYRSLTINGEPGPGYSSTQAMEAVREIAGQVLPKGMQFVWSGMSYQEQEAGSRGTISRCSGGHSSELGPLRTGRYGHAGRTLGKKCHSDRRVCQGLARRTRVHDPRGGRRSCPAPFPPGRDDCPGFHPRSVAAGVGDRSGVDRPTYSRDHGLWRNDCGGRSGDSLDSGFLRGQPVGPRVAARTEAQARTRVGHPSAVVPLPRENGSEVPGFRGFEVSRLQIPEPVHSAHRVQSVHLVHSAHLPAPSTGSPVLRFSRSHRVAFGVQSAQRS
ncbi:MAG: efflux RND transporter permease subunit, partial [Acidobacteriota bacterium]